MLKKALIAVGATALLGTFFFGRDAWSYVTTGADKLQTQVRDNVPIEFELDRARKMAHDLTPVINESKHRIAQEEVALELLGKRIATIEDKQARDRGEIMTLKSDLERQESFYVYAGKQFSATDVAVDLARRFERFKVNDQQLDSLKKMQEARARGVAATRQKLEGMIATRRQLEAEIENLHARLEMVRAAETISEFAIDDSAVGRVKNLVGDLEQRIEVLARVTDQETDAFIEIPVNEPGPVNILDQVNAYMSGPTESLAPAATPIVPGQLVIAE